MCVPLESLRSPSRMRFRRLWPLGLLALALASTGCDSGRQNPPDVVVRALNATAEFPRPHLPARPARDPADAAVLPRGRPTRLGRGHLQLSRGLRRHPDANVGRSRDLPEATLDRHLVHVRAVPEGRKRDAHGPRVGAGRDHRDGCADSGFPRRRGRADRRPLHRRCGRGRRRRDAVGDTRIRGNTACPQHCARRLRHDRHRARQPRACAIHVAELHSLRGRHTDVRAYTGLRRGHPTLQPDGAERHVHGARGPEPAGRCSRDQRRERPTAARRRLQQPVHAAPVPGRSVCDGDAVFADRAGRGCARST